MIIRKFAAAVIAAGLMLSASACSFNPNPESLQSYAPSEGVGADIDLGGGQGIKLRNFIYLSDGTDGALLGVIANSGTEAQEVTINYTPAGEAAQSQSITVAGNTSYSFGFNGNPASQITVAGKPGDLAEISFGVKNNSEWSKLSIPILDGSLAHYRDIVADIPGFLNQFEQPCANESADQELCLNPDPEVTN